MAEENPAVQRQTAVTAYFTSKQLLLFVFARRSVSQYSMAEDNPAVQRQTAVTAHFTIKQLLLFVFVSIQRQTAVTAYVTNEMFLLFVVVHVNRRDMIWTLGTLSSMADPEIDRLMAGGGGGDRFSVEFMHPTSGRNKCSILPHAQLKSCSVCHITKSANHRRHSVAIKDMTWAQVPIMTIRDMYVF